MAVVGTNVTAANYNTIQSKIDDVLGAGDGAQNGYGRTLTSSAKTSGDTIAAQDMLDLYTDLVKARTHQTNPVTWTNAVEPPDADENVGASAADVGNDTPIDITALTFGIEYQILSTDLDPNNTSDFTLIGASANEVGIKFTATGPGTGSGQAKLSPTSANAEEDLAEGYLDFEAAADEIVADINVHDATNFSITTKLSDTRTSQWGGGDYAQPGTKITHEAEITWSNADERRYFFNTGGQIQFNADLIGAVTANSKDDNWNTILANMGTISFGKNAVTSNGSSPGTSASFGNYYASWGLTSSSNQVTIFTKNGSGLYADIKYQITAWEEAAGNASTPSTLRFRIEFQDNDFSSGPTDVDEYVTNDITSNVSVRHDTVLSIPSPTFTTITSLDDGAATQTSASLSKNPNGPINEGQNVTFTLQVNPVANGTLIDYTLGGLGISVGDFANSQGMGGQFNMQNGTGSVTITLANDEFTDGAETLTLTVPAFGLTSSIGINDTSVEPLPPPAVASYSISGPSSISEGSSGTYTVSITDAPDGTYFYSVVNAGVMTSDAGNFTVTGGNGTFALTAANDAVVGDNETISVSLRQGSSSGTILANTSTSIVDTTVPPTSYNFYAMEYYPVRDLSTPGNGGEFTYAPYARDISKTQVTSSNSSAPLLQNVTENRRWAGGNTQYTWTKAATDNRIDVLVIGGGASGRGTSVATGSNGAAAGGGGGGASFKTYSDGDVPSTAYIVVGKGGDSSLSAGSSGAPDINRGRDGDESSFGASGFSSQRYSHVAEEQFFVYWQIGRAIWVWNGQVIKDASGANAGVPTNGSIHTFNGVTYQAGTQQNTFNIGSGAEPITAQYHGIRIQRGSQYATGGEQANQSTSSASGGAGFGGSINYSGTATSPPSPTFNTLQASTGGVPFIGSVVANRPDNVVLSSNGALTSNLQTDDFKAGQKQSIPSVLQDLIGKIEIQGGFTRHYNSSSSPALTTNGIGPGAGGGGESARYTSTAMGGQGQPGLVVVKRYRSGPAKQFTEYVAQGSIGLIAAPFFGFGTTTTGYGTSVFSGLPAGTITQNFTTTTGSHSIVRASIASSNTLIGGIGISVTLFVTFSGNMPAELLHSVDAWQNVEYENTWIRTAQTLRTFDGTNTTFSLQPNDGILQLHVNTMGTNGISGGTPWQVANTWNLRVRTIE